MGPKIHLLLVITSFLGKFSIKTSSSSSSSYCQNNQQIDQFKSTIINGRTTDKCCLFCFVLSFGDTLKFQIKISRNFINV